jgi:hypothetical protein
MRRPRWHSSSHLAVDNEALRLLGVDPALALRAE